LGSGVVCLGVAWQGRVGIYRKTPMKGEKT